ncbi:MAG: DUF4230 domain-containing protein [Limisphaerales bacterium]
MSRGFQGWLLPVAAALLAGLVLGLATSRVLRPGGGPARPGTAVLLKEIQGLGELVTVKYVIEQVVVTEDPAWYGDSRVILLAHGVVKAGMDLVDFTESDLDADGDVLRIRLPRFRITDVYLDDHRTQVIERTTGLLRRFDKGLEQEARQEAVLTFRSTALKGGILREAEAQAQAQLGALGRRMGFARVEFSERAP